MGILHFLNVKEGDCSIIEHESRNVTVIDVCNAKPTDEKKERLIAQEALKDFGIRGNFQQKYYPVNPTTYMRDHGINVIFRYIQTHPDMDHMDGIKTLFDVFELVNFWDTNNTKEIPDSGWEGSSYNKSDWDIYKKIRESSPMTNPKRLALYTGAEGQYYNIGVDGNLGGDGLYILAPTKELVDKANEIDDNYNRCSYVILYKTAYGNRIIFGGDSHDDTWDYIIKNNNKEDITDIDLLIAPHHGRKFERAYEYLDILNPKLTLFGNARCEHLAYDAWYYRDLPFITNNQANCMVVDTNTNPLTLYVTNGKFAKKINPDTYYSYTFGAWYVGTL